MYVINPKPINHTSPHARAARIRGFLNTFRLIPDDFFLALCLEDMTMHVGSECILGRLEKMIRMYYDTDDSTWYGGTPEKMVHVFGGTNQEWYRIFRGVFTPDSIHSREELDGLGHGFEDEIELAFVRRLEEAVVSHAAKDLIGANDA